MCEALNRAAAAAAPKHGSKTTGAHTSASAAAAGAPADAAEHAAGAFDTSDDPMSEHYLDEEMKALLKDREALNNLISATTDVQVSRILGTDDQVTVIAVCR